MSTTSLEALIDEWLADCRARGLSAKTLKDAYGYPLKQVLLPWAKRQGVTQPAQLDKGVLNRFTSELLEVGGKRGPLSRYTVDTYVRNVNLFLNWCRREGEVGTDVRAQGPKLNRRVLDVLSRDEIDRLEAVGKTERDKMVVRLLADTGIRAGELVGITTGSLVEQGRDRYLKVLGKGARERLVPLQPQLYRRLQRLVRSRPADATGDKLFIGLRRRAGGGHEPLTVSGVEQLLRFLGQEAGLGKRVYPHLLRHSFATTMLNRGMDPITLSRILGHSSLVMIQRTYSHQTASDLSGALLRALAGN